MATTRHIFKCEVCKCAWARNYAVLTRTSQITGHDYFYEARIVEGVEIEVTTDYRGRCPKCNAGSRAISGKEVFKKVASSAHKCNAKCLNAKGNECACECGSENHGKGLLI